ncbi:hypothetical protein JQ615_34495 [Bradyrhizobium jicamae]|uniref:Calcium-binding protein n=1 Tax=Bradyrhizobium jicamae TaxID=280332 RepID=A0ABS5FUM2_9BRAD|nr:calcium-binding protein [Bradyrhizobium jicamae]MBR0800489.1 hypothetical protein [Bradyrhizobium jicamae]
MPDWLKDGIMGTLWRTPVLFWSVQPNPLANGSYNGSNSLSSVALAPFGVGAGLDDMAVVYLQGGYSNYPDLSYGSIELQLVDPMGKALGNPQALASGGYSPNLVGSVVSTPGVTALSNGWIAVSYTAGSYNAGTLRTDVFATLVAPDGIPQMSAQLDSSVGNETNATITPTTGGGFLAVWQDNLVSGTGSAGGDGSGSGIDAQFFSFDGIGAGQFRVDTLTAGDQRNPSAATLANGDFLVSWISGANVKAQTYTAGGVASGTETTLATAPGGGASVGYDKVVALSGGGFALVWDYTNSVIGTTENPVIDVQIFNAAGVAVGPENQIDGLGVGYFITSIDAAATSDGGVTVVYDDNDGFLGRTSVERYHILGDGSLADTSTITTSSSSATAAGGGAIGVYSDGRESIMWEQQQPSFADTLQEAIFDDRSMTTFYASAAQPVAVGSVSNDLIYGFNGPDTLIGGGGDDTIYGGSGTNLIDLGNTGSSYAFGGSANDILYAGAGGADVLHGSAGSDLLYGGGGTDWLYGDGGGIDEMFGGSGTNYLFGDATNPTDVEIMVGGSGVTVMTGGIGKNYFYGGTGAATIYGGAGLNIVSLGAETIGDTVYGGTGQNYIYGGAGPDLLEGGPGSNLIVGGNGTDLFYGGSGNSTMYGGTGNDIYVGGDGLSYEVGRGTATSLDYFYLSSAQGSEAYGTNAGESVFLAGTNGSVMIGQGANDFMYAEGGTNYFYGGTGFGEFFGGNGVDIMVGGSGNDYFDGGTGVNYYYGGNGGGPGAGIGIDTFNVSLGGGDVIQDWTEGKDTVQLNGSGFTSFSDILAHSYQNGAYFVVQVNPETAVWLNGATASSVNANDFRIVS